MTVLYAQIPTEAYEYVTNPFIQPNDSTLNWYGSGDVNNDTVVDWDDITRLDQLINNTFFDPADRRLYDRADVDGNAFVNAQDMLVLQDYLNRLSPYLPGQWNKLRTKAEKVDWLQKMLAIDRSDTTCFISGQPLQDCGCHQYSAQMLINFNGYTENDLYEFLRTYPYNTLNNGRFNLPILRFTVIPYVVGDIGWVHVMNTILIGENAINWYDYSNIEPQVDSLNIQFGEHYLKVGELSNGITTDSLLMVFEGPPVDHYSYDYPIAPLSIQIAFTAGIENEPRFNRLYKSSEYINMIMLRDFDNPTISVSSPVNGGFYSTSPRLIANFKDSTVFDMFKWKDGIPDRWDCDTNGNCVFLQGEKLFYNSYIWYSLDNGITRIPIFKNTNINLNLPNGNYTLMVHAADDFGNESSMSISFTVDLPSSVSDQLKNKISFYPNPVKDIGKFTYLAGKLVKIELYDIAGTLIRTIEDHDRNGETQVDFDDINTGLYLYRLVDEDGLVYRGKVVRE